MMSSVKNVLKTDKGHDGLLGMIFIPGLAVKGNSLYGLSLSSHLKTAGSSLSLLSPSLLLGAIGEGVAEHGIEVTTGGNNGKDGDVPADKGSDAGEEKFESGVGGFSRESGGGTGDKDRTVVCI